MEPEKTPRERAEDLISLLVSDWRPSREQVLWTIRIVLGLVVLQALFVLIGVWLWEVIAHYVHPRTPSDRKDLVNVFVIIGAGVVGILTAIAALGNLYISRRNLQNAQATMRQQRDLEERRAQEDALQSYFEQMGGLLTDQDLINTDREDVRQLAQAQSHTVLARLDGPRKGALLRFLHVAELIRTNDLMEEFLRVTRQKRTDKPIVKLDGADLSGADLSGAVLYGVVLSKADLSGADLSEAKLNRAALVQTNLNSADLRGAVLGMAVLVWADLSGADLSGALCSRADLRASVLRGVDLSGARLSKADLSRADLSRANLSEASLKEANLSNVRGVTDEELEQQATSLEGATMPNGQKYEDWLKDKGDSGEDEATPSPQ
jgi:uncharacterized protein YjbI with pentapeptide repeats